LVFSLQVGDHFFLNLNSIIPLGHGETFLEILFAQVSPEEWQNIPEVGDGRNRKKRLAGVREKYTPISDRILSNSLGRSPPRTYSCPVPIVEDDFIRKTGTSKGAEQLAQLAAFL
jgi:hypothetical protein